MPQHKKKPVTWVDVHEHYGTLLTLITDTNQVLVALNACSLEGDKAKTLADTTTSVSLICNAAKVLNIGDLPCAATVVNDDVFMQYYNTFTNITKLIDEMNQVVSVVEVLAKELTA